jgi:cell division transport system permease protein
MGLILAVCTVLLVAATIRLAFHTRRQAMEIMHLVGADRRFISAPFLVEGALYGLAGAALGLVLLGLIFLVISRYLSGARFIPAPILLGLLIFGPLLGILGSLLSLRRSGR